MVKYLVIVLVVLILWCYFSSEYDSELTQTPLSSFSTERQKKSGRLSEYPNDLLKQKSKK